MKCWYLSICCKPLEFELTASLPTSYPVTTHKCITAIHDILGFELYSELPGHFFTLNLNFDEVKAECYHALIIPGGRFIELLNVDNKVLSIVKGFADAGKSIVGKWYLVGATRNHVRF
ncbi:hypothetical protein V6N13_087275 [Hibiscus sabdariffa]